MSAELSQITAAFSTLRTTARILAPVGSKATNNNRGVQNEISLFWRVKKLLKFKISYLWNKKRFYVRTKFRVNFDNLSDKFL